MDVELIKGRLFRSRPGPDHPTRPGRAHRCTEADRRADPLLRATTSAILKSCGHLDAKATREEAM
jgi:hypothetical protein